MAGALLALAGCTPAARTRATSQSKWTPQVSARELLDTVAKRREAIQGLRGTARLQVTLQVEREGSVQDDRVSTTQAVLVRAPSSFRLESVTAFGVGYAVASDGEDLAVFVPSEGLVYRGQARAQTVGAATGVPADPADVAQVLLGVPPIPALDERAAVVSAGLPAISKDHSELDLEVEPVIYLTARSKPAEVKAPRRRRGRAARATVKPEPPETIVIGFAPPVEGSHQLVPILVERHSESGGLLLRAHFGGFRSGGNTLLATHIGLEVQSSRAELEYRTLALDTGIAPTSFALRTPSGMRDATLDLPPGSAGRLPRGS